MNAVVFIDRVSESVVRFVHFRNQKAETHGQFAVGYIRGQFIAQRCPRLLHCVVAVAHARLPLVAVRYAVVLVAARLGFNDADCDQQRKDDNGSRDNVDRDSFENARSFCHR